MKKISFSGLFLGLALVLPFITGQIPEIGSMLCPMHIPVFLCAMICGWKYGLVVGFTAPLLRSLIFSMPVMFPNAFAMSFELATYGLVCGLVYVLTTKVHFNSYIALAIANIAGRLVWVLVMYVLFFLGSAISLDGISFFGLFISSWPGIIVQFLIVPPIVKIVSSIK